jgi:nitrate reductase gamma subunit
MSPHSALWAVLPYVAVAVFLLGHLWRFNQDRFGWTDEWMQLFKARKARWGIVLFHAGAFAVIAGHVLGILVPKRLTADLGVSEGTYRIVAVGLGGVFGLCVVVGLGAFIWRRTLVPPIVANTTWIDRITLGLLALVIVLGMIETLGVNLLGGGYDYRLTVAVWFRSLLTLSPRPDLIASAPLIYQLHALTAWLVVMIWPFSRLVHVWYFPFYARRRLLARGDRSRMPERV